MDMDMQHGHAHALIGHRSTVKVVHEIFFSHFCHPSRVQAADDGRPGLLLHVYFKGCMTAAVFSFKDNAKTKAAWNFLAPTTIFRGIITFLLKGSKFRDHPVHERKPAFQDVSAT
jgi:hypothetical protein